MVSSVLSVLKCSYKQFKPNVKIKSEGMNCKLTVRVEPDTTTLQLL